MISKALQNLSNVSDLGASSIVGRQPLGHIVALGFLVALIFLVNFMVIYLFSTRDTLRTNTNRILVSLAVSDMINGVITIPLQIGCDQNKGDRSLRLASMVLYRFLASSTMLHILAVTLERHICVVFPLHYHSLVTRQRTIVVLCIVWMTSIFYAVIGLSWIGLANDFDHLDHPPGLSESKLLRIEFSYTIIGFLLCFFIPLIIMTYSFTKILREISRHNRRESELMLSPDPASESAAGNRGTNLKMDRKPVLIFLTMLLVFVLSWSTWYVQLFILCIAPQRYMSLFGFATSFVYLRFTTSLINPLLYALVKKDLREALKKCIARCQRRSTLTANNEFTLKSLNTI